MGRLILNTTTDILQIPVGAKITLLDGRTCVVDENIGDGQWLSCTFDDEESELVHSQDIAEVEVDG